MFNPDDAGLLFRFSMLMMYQNSKVQQYLFSTQFKIILFLLTMLIVSNLCMGRHLWSNISYKYIFSATEGPELPYNYLLTLLIFNEYYMCVYETIPGGY